MAVSWRVLVCTSVWCLWVTLCAFGSSVSANGGEELPSFACAQVRELFEGDFGAPQGLHVKPEPEADSSVCRRGKGDNHDSCCSQLTEVTFAEVAEKRLKEKVRTQNHALKKHLTNLLAKYQDRIAQLVAEAQNRTSVFLSRLHKIPWAQHEGVVREFFAGLQRIVLRGPTADPQLEETVREFFSSLFPPVFNYVLTVQGQEERQPVSSEYHACLKRYAEQIQPFGNQPDVIFKHLRHTVKHARVLQEALRTFTDTMTSTETVSMDTSCRHALLRLQVCPGCRGVTDRRSQVKPCGGLCLNVMRGCLAKLSELSSAWDDLVVAFENVQVGMMGRHDLQKTLLYVDMNVSDAIMMAMGDSPRISAEVQVKCRHLAQHADDKAHAPHPPPPGHGGGDEEDDGLGHPQPHPQPQPQPPAPSLPLVPEEASEVIPARNAQRLHAFQQEVRAVVKALDDSKGLLHRLPDALCQDPARYSQDMQSPDCWNGTALGRYMEQVPEANFLSQVQHNKEVKINLMDPDRDLLVVKETLTHMRRNLSGVLNSEIMLGDGPIYKNVARGGDSREGSGYGGYQPVIVDDEDLVAYGSGSGSGSGDDRDEEDEGVSTAKPEDPYVKPKPTRPPTPPPSSSPRTSSWAAVVLLCVLCQRLLRTAL